MQIGTFEFIIIILVATIVLGPENATRYAVSIGKFLRVLKTYVMSLSEDLEIAVVEPIREMEEPLRAIAEPVEELKNSILEPIQEVNRDVDQTLKQAVQEIGAVANTGENKEDKRESLSEAGDSEESKVFGTDQNNKEEEKKTA